MYTTDASNVEDTGPDTEEEAAWKDLAQAAAEQYVNNPQERGIVLDLMAFSSSVRAEDRPEGTSVMEFVGNDVEYFLSLVEKEQNKAIIEIIEDLGGENV